jgi:hypothetical protein
VTDANSMQHDPVPPREASAQLPTSSIGLPGEETSLSITFSTKDGEIGSPAGQPGEYDIVFFFRRPDAAIASTDFSFDTEHHNGSSLLAIANPALKFNDSRLDVADTKIKLYVAVGSGLTVEAFGFPNNEGCLSDVRATLQCDSFADASKNVFIGYMITALHLRFNFTSSMAVGIYRLVPLPKNGVRRGMLVAACAPPDAAELGRRRGIWPQALARPAQNLC